MCETEKDISVYLEIDSREESFVRIQRGTAFAS